MTVRPIRRALLSVWDKTGLVAFARFLAGEGVELISTGGSARALTDEGIDVTEVSTITGFPEILDGRVKTLHPAIHGGLLARRDTAEHMTTIAAHDIAPIDLVVSSLYPFELKTASDASPEDIIEMIDIGGPALTRAAAKNHDGVVIVTDADDYLVVMDEMRRQDGATSLDLRRRLAAKAFARTAAYDVAVANWFAARAAEPLAERLVISASRRQLTRYGENPHQKAAFYITGESRPGVATARQIQGKELSYNNLGDTDAAFELACEFDRPACAIIKHANPSGVAVAHDLAAAYESARACDPVSAFGGIVAVNRRLDAATAKAIAGIFTEVVIAPDADDEALDILAGKSSLRLILTAGLADPAAASRTIRSVAGGLLVQERDTGHVDADALKIASRRAPTTDELADLMFAWTVAKHVKSNAIVFARGGASVGIGAGQMSRVDSVRIAVAKAAEHEGSRPSVVASDAFFPFADGIEAAIEAGATAFIQPGGSRRDAEVIAAADTAGAAMVMTGMRHFRH